jgi:hypothetical protein
MDEKTPAAELEAARTPAGQFRALVARCIKSYGSFFDDGLSLDYNRVTETKLRSMILQDPEYRQETRYLYAKRIMDNIHEMDELSQLAAGMYEEEDEDYDVRGVKQKKKRPASADKDMITMRFRAAQERRELLSEVNKVNGDALDAINLFFIPITAEEFARLETVEIFEERDIDEREAMDALAGTLKEKLPEAENVTTNQIQPRHTGEPLKLGFDEEGNVILC